jgi:hypothetical protein
MFPPWAGKIARRGNYSSIGLEHLRRLDRYQQATAKDAEGFLLRGAEGAKEFVLWIARQKLDTKDERL